MIAVIMENSTHSNSTDEFSCPFAFSIFFTMTMAVISTAAFIGNILVIVTVYKTLSLRTSTNHYYVNMAVSDFLATLTTWPLYLTNEIITSNGSLIQGSLATVGCKVGVFFRMVSTLVSILSLVLIAVDRFIATIYPLKATLITQKLRTSLLVAVWLISTAYCTPMLYFYRAEVVGQQIYCKFAWNASALTVYNINGLALFVVMPLITIIIFYSCIMHTFRKMTAPKYHVRCSSQQNRNIQIKNIMKIFRSIVLAFFISYSFYCVYLILKITYSDIFIKDKCKLILGFGYFVLPSLSTAINPVILFTFSTNFRQGLRISSLWPSLRTKPVLGCKAKHIPVHEGESQVELVTFTTMKSWYSS